jgi:hypothetical protein
MASHSVSTVFKIVPCIGTDEVTDSLVMFVTMFPNLFVCTTVS